MTTILPADANGARALGGAHVILPAFNEAEALPDLLPRLAEIAANGPGLRAWVVDDGSTDDTAAIVRRGVEGLDIRLISHPTNLGLGAALQSGIKAVLQAAHDDDFVVVMDADDTHDVSVIEAMTWKLRAGADIVVASRFVDNGDDQTAPPFRRFLSRGASLVFRICLPITGPRDFTSGFRAYRVSLLRRATNHFGDALVTERGFACMVELLLKLRYCRPLITEVPMVLRYDRKRTPSKLKLARTIVQYIKLAVRDRLSPPPVRDL
jgi:dolichol-phosphate mannosyltransferase